ncbi:MAG TPA: hypothetical protein IAA76_08810 [Candidatus Ornithospirochaeta stercorigallinarum]|nr:hypothetical protein [Candidatus Ornithospirochaeta stercorigallinarum]
MEEEKERRKGLDKEKRSLWEKRNKVFIGLNLMKSTDSDIIGYLDREVAAGKSRQCVIKEALREKIEKSSN